MAALDSMKNDTCDLELTEKIATQLFMVVCKNGGSMDVVQAVQAVGAEGGSYISEYGIYPLLKSSIRDVLKLESAKPGNRATLRAVVKVQLCADYKKSKCYDSDCPRLHVCPFFVTGNCRYGRRCRYRHDFEGDHEQNVLMTHKLNGLDRSALLTILRQENFGSDSQVCPDYNSNIGCPEGGACRKLHLCKWFDKGICKKGKHCERSHSLAEENKRILSLGLQNLARSMRQASMLTTCLAVGARPKLPSIDEICGFHIKGTCQYGNLCDRHWCNLPYLWQILTTSTDRTEKWIGFARSFNQKIENDFCNVCKDTSVEIKFPLTGGQEILFNIYFEDMVAKDETETYTLCIRRLSTASWLNATPGDTYATHWTWYWVNDQNQWTPYEGGGLNATGSFSDSCNEKLEESFLSGAETFALSLNQYEYNIDFKNLVQTNTTTGKARKLRRRPTKFIGEEDMGGLSSKVQQEQQLSAISCGLTVKLPREWTTMTADQEFGMVNLAQTAEEYRLAESEFKKTMSGKIIHKIERIQNVDLWESYSRKMSKISRKLGRHPEVRQLFHGTNETSVKAICQQGFDWRLCGVHGTSFGKGSYFAKNASYSDGYAGNSQQGHKLMFLAKVIVGSYVVGNSNTVRPPPMNPLKPHELHHSCVDNQISPSIFVIFENDQAYPELLITYS